MSACRRPRGTLLHSRHPSCERPLQRLHTQKKARSLGGYRMNIRCAAALAGSGLGQRCCSGLGVASATDAVNIAC
eukprot:scaffold13971_cov69-Phaeocystis_antarctica.AAC.7